jgi:hypothetical protein
MFGLFKPKPLFVSVNGNGHELRKGERIEAVAPDGSSLHVTRHVDGSIIIDAYEPVYRTGKRNHR